jgi:hypothetical protein
MNATLKKIWAPALLIFAVGLSIFLTSEKLSSKIGIFIQAASIIILALITWEYARQTRILAELQEKTLIDLIKKRNIDFLERSFDEFFSQFEEEYFPLRDAYKRKNFEDAERVNSNLRKFLIKNLYMMGKDRFAKITKFVRDLRSAAKVGNWEKVEAILKEQEEEIKQLVIGEAVSMAAKIQEFHKQPR